MSMHRILIVEDEIIIADTIQRYLEQKGYEVLGIAISYEEAIELLMEKKPDLALLDIRLSGPKNGIDLAHYIQNAELKIPFIYLTSQLDSLSIDQAKETFPAGYLSKPIQIDSLFATIEIAIHSHLSKLKNEVTIVLTKGNGQVVIPCNDILFIQAEHIYVNVHTIQQDLIIHRSTLKEIIDQLPSDQFIQTHRSFAINVQHISRWDHHHVYIREQAIPISRTRKKEIIALMPKS